MPEALLRRLRKTAAEQLAVEHPDRVALWLLRLFIRPSVIRPPADRQPTARQIGWISRWPALARARQQLAALPLSQLLRWALLAPPPSSLPAKSSPLAWLANLLTRLACSLSAVKQRVLSLLPAIDLPGLGAQLEQRAAVIDNVSTALRWLMAAIALGLLWVMVTTPLPLWGQLLFFSSTFAVALLARKVPGNFASLIMICLSCAVTLRYMWWRITETMSLEYNTDYLMGIPLLMAEIYTWVTLYLGYLQTAWPLRRTSTPLPADSQYWPHIDVFIPTYNEPMAVVQPTVLAAKSMDWPADRLTIYLLDDGNRPEFRELAERTGVNYIARGYNSHAKAGNLNHALQHSTGEFIAIFDCDHLPVRSFLQTAMGWFLKDPKCAMVQTPHNFFSPDPFERNFKNFRRVPNEGELFYGLIQDGNDLWNATFFCGSCAVIRRAPLEQIGGIAVETVTEDAHTALKLHRLGYNTAYLNNIQANGLATESLSSHIGQRIRWARGMAQIFRLDNPLFGKGLSLFQRLCYSNAMLHYFYGIPRLIFLTAPLSYLFFELHIIDTPAFTLALYALPHILHSNLANSRLQGRHRYSFWASIYESVLAWYIVLPTTLAFINPKLGKFNVTAKGGLIEKDYFDWTISRPYLILLSLNFLGFVIGLFRLFWWNIYEPGPVLLNLSWTTYNLVILGATLGVAAEARQIRRTHRVAADLPAVLTLADGTTVDGRMHDFSLGGLGLQVPASTRCRVGEALHITLSDGEKQITLPADVVLRRDDKLGVNFSNLTLQQETELLQCTFSRADLWESWRDVHQKDQPLKALGGILKLSALGYRGALAYVADSLQRRWPRSNPNPNPKHHSTQLPTGTFQHDQSTLAADAA